MQFKDGKIVTREKGTPQGGCISPILSNLFLHYSFDAWMERNFSQIPYCRYADDGLLHCKSQKQAEFLRQQISKRFNDCGLELNAEKTRIVYCRDSNRKGKAGNDKFDFLGFTFRTRTARSPSSNQLFAAFTPSVSKTAMKSMKRTIKYEWNLRSKLHYDLESLAKEINPIIQGWINYYGKFNFWNMKPIFDYANKRIRIWARRKHKKLASREVRSCKWLKRVYDTYPKLFAHWKVMPVY